MLPRRFDEIRIENTNHCGYRCWFCPRESLTRELGHMSEADFALVIDRLPDECQSIDLHGFGEPLLDGGLVAKVALARRKWPQGRLRIITTLGVRGASDIVAGLAGAGLDELEVSFYGGTSQEYRQAHGVNTFALARANLEAVQAAPLEGLHVVVRKLDGSLGPADRAQDGGEARQQSIATGKLHNFGSGRRFNRAPDSAVCSIVDGFRSRVLQVTWKLDVIPCCFDYDAQVVWGNLRSQTLDEIFSGAARARFIADHLAGRSENYAPCANCETCQKP